MFLMLCYVSVRTAFNQESVTRRVDLTHTNSMKTYLCYFLPLLIPVTQVKGTWLILSLWLTLVKLAWAVVLKSDREMGHTL